MRRYLAIIQDARGYPAPGEPLDKAPPEGPEQPMVYSVVKADEHDAEVARLRGALEQIEGSPRSAIGCEAQRIAREALAPLRSHTGHTET